MGGHSFAIAGSFRNVDRSDKNSAVSHRFQRPIKKKTKTTTKKKKQKKNKRKSLRGSFRKRSPYYAPCSLLGYLSLGSLQFELRLG